MYRLLCQNYFSFFFLFPDVVEYLYHSKIPEIQNALTDKFLPRITYKNGEIDILDEESNHIVVATDTIDLKNR